MIVHGTVDHSGVYDELGQLGLPFLIGNDQFDESKIMMEETGYSKILQLFVVISSGVAQFFCFFIF